MDHLLESAVDNFDVTVGFELVVSLGTRLSALESSIKLVYLIPVSKVLKIY